MKLASGHVARRVLVVAALLVAHPATAAEPNPADLENAKAWFAQAEEAERAGDFARALPLLERVLAVKETAGVLFHRANCEENLGRLAAALATFRRAEARAAVDGASDVTALTGARIRALEDRVPTIVVVLEGASAAARLTVDGRPRTLTGATTTLRLDPGPHRLVVEVPGAPAAERAVTLLERAAVRETFAFEVPGPAAGPTRSPAAPPAPAAPRAPAAPGFPILPAALGLAALGATAPGTALFLVADDRNDEGRAACDAGACRAADVAAVHDLDRAAVAAWAGAVVLGGAAIASAVLDVGPRVGRGAARTRLAIGPGGVRVRGSF